jgi:thiamine biosynthesis lipoprotein
MRIALIVCTLSVAFIACGGAKELAFNGRTMGTFYSVKLVGGHFTDVSDLVQKVEKRLEDVNRSMSTYRPDSEISRFNDWQSIDQPFQISADFLHVMTVAERIHRLSGGAWDATVDPLVNLWGFGRRETPVDMPDADAIRRAKANVGFNRIHIDPQGYLIKRNPLVTLDLASIAKGYGVDALAELLQREGIRDFLVEIGGEVYAAGRKKDGSPWRVGVNTPAKDAAATGVYKVISLSDRALATSGDYRNFIEIDGRHYSHVIDPRSGYPTANRIVSVSIEAATCTLADGLATAVMVMGIRAGLELVDRLDGVEGLIVERRPDGSLADHYSRGHKFVDIE